MYWASLLDLEFLRSLKSILHNTEHKYYKKAQTLPIWRIIYSREVFLYLVIQVSWNGILMIQSSDCGAMWVSWMTRLQDLMQEIFLLDMYSIYMRR